MDKEKIIVSYFKLNEKERQESYLATNGLAFLKKGLIAVGKAHFAVLEEDGRVIAYGDNSCGQCDTQGWENVSKVVAGDYHTAALLRDGTVVATGDNTFGQCNVGAWKNITDIYAVNHLTVGVQADGTVTVAARTQQNENKGQPQPINNTTNIPNPNQTKPSDSGNSAWPEKKKEIEILEQKASFLPIGKRLQGRYIVVKILVNSTDSVTYIGYDDKNGTVVNIREFLPVGLCTRDSSNDSLVTNNGSDAVYSEYLEEFKNIYTKVKKYSELTAITNILDIFEENNTVYAIEEVDDVIPFEEYIKRSGDNMEWDTARPLFMPLLSALSQLNSDGLYHLGVAPDNLVVTSAGKIRLINFAINEVRQKGNKVADVLYSGCSAPEQYDEDGVIDEQTEIYGFTATLFYALAGKLPANAVKRKEGGRLLISTNIVKKLPPNVVDILANGLKVDKKQRISDFETMRAQLSAATTANEQHVGSEITDSDFEWEEAGYGIKIIKYNGSKETVVIPETIEGKPVRVLGDSAFWCSSAVKHLVLPKQLSLIGTGAFSNCINLEKVEIPYGTEKIGRFAFDSCRKLETLTLPSSVKEIGSYAFGDCTNLSEIVIPDSVREIGADAFVNCKKLKNVKISPRTRERLDPMGKIIPR